MARIWRPPLAMALRLMLLKILWKPCFGFLDEILNQAFGGGGGGGGQRFHFQMGGHPGMQRRQQRIDWPSGYSDSIAKKFNLLKGTEWTWNSRRARGAAKFHKDGKFEGLTQECQRELCKWAANKGKVFVLLGTNGVHELEFNGEIPAEQDEEKMAGLSLSGVRVQDGSACSATFGRVFDTEAAELAMDLYDILGLQDDADEAEIKKVYKKLAIKYHPDKVGDDKAAKARFKKIRDAYEILNNPEKKILYDTGGMEAVKELDKGNVETGGDIAMEVGVDLEDLYNSATTKASINRRVVCTGCRSKPESPKCRGCRKCPNEVKMVHRQMGPGMIVQQQVEVPSKEFCKQDDTVLEVHVERGMRDGDTIVFPRMSEQRPGMIPGNVVATVKVEGKHKRFERKGDDLHTKMKISLRESLLGFTRTVDHLDRHIVEITSKGITKPLQVFKVKGEGMPLRDDPATFGNLYLTVEVVFPKQLTKTQRDKVDALFTEPSPHLEL